MEFISNAIPMPSKGSSFKGIKKQVVPDQSMSLHEILQRFTRGEAVPVGQPVTYDQDSEHVDSVDLEKMANADLVDKAEYYQTLEDTKQRFEKQEKAREKKKREKEEADQKAAYEARVLSEAEKLVKGKGNLPNA